MSLAKFNTIEELVRHYVPFVHGFAKGGWNKVYCEACGDGSRTKGPRGGWLFQDEVAFYHCFNCGTDGTFAPWRKYPRSKEMFHILESFGVPENEIKVLEFRNKGKAPKDSPTSVVRPIEVLPIPDHFYPLIDADEDDAIAEAAKAFLWDEKRINYTTYPFYLSTGVVSMDEDAHTIVNTKGLRNRLIIPAFRGEDMIFYQSRRLDGIEKNKYLSCDKPRSNIIYNMDRLYDDIRSPLFVCEGFFDSHHLNGVALMENNVSSQQAELLNRSPRKKVIVPDYKNDHNKLVEVGLKHGWGISKPNFGSEVKDITEAVKKYGRLFVAHEIVRNIKYGEAAKIASRMKF